MSELTPGLFVNPWVPHGQAYVLNIRAIGLSMSGLGGSDRAVAISEGDWNAIPGAEREKLLDEFTRRSAEVGVDQLAAWLAARVRSAA